MRAASCIVFVLLHVLVMAQSAGTEPAPTSSLKIHVVDPLGAVIAKSFVLLHSDSLERGNPKPFSLEMRTNTDGDAKAEVPSGFYDVFVGRTGFAPHCEKLRLRDGKPVSVKVVLKVDRLMTQEYGDRFER